jgi:acyl carrier protein
MRTFNQIVSTIFSVEEATIVDTMSSKDIADWDSMNYLLFISELENEFKISFSMDEVMNAKTLGDIRRIVLDRKG